MKNEVLDLLDICYECIAKKECFSSFLSEIYDLKVFLFLSDSTIVVSLFIFFLVLQLISYSKNYRNIISQNFIIFASASIMVITCYSILNDLVVFFYITVLETIVSNDGLALVSKIIIVSVSFFYLLLIGRFLKYQKLKTFEYIVVIILAIFGLFILVSAKDFITSYLAIELSSLSFYILASYQKSSNYCGFSGLKYFVIGSISSVIFLFGSSALYISIGTINFVDIIELFSVFNFETVFNVISASLRHYPQETRDVFAYLLLDYAPAPRDNCVFVDEYPNDILANKTYFNLLEWSLGSFYMKTFGFLQIGLTFILFSFFIKLALAPFHIWSLDVYEGSPTSSTVFFAVLTKLSLFVFLVHLCYKGFLSTIKCWQFYSVLLGIISIFVGAVSGLRQRKLKVLLAYSSVSHMGYALLAFSVGNLEGLQALLYYLLIYIISNLGLWSVLLFIVLKRNSYEEKFSKELTDLTLLNQTNAGLAIVLAITVFSIAGIPPMIGFIAKLSIFLTVLGGFLYFSGLFGSLFSIISTFYYIRFVKVSYYENVLVGKLCYFIDTNVSLIVGFFSLLLVFLFFFPSLTHIISVNPF